MDIQAMPDADLDGNIEYHLLEFEAAALEGDSHSALYWVKQNTPFIRELLRRADLCLITAH